MQPAKLLLSASDADRVVEQRPTQDGEGVKLSRIGGRHLNAVLDPFLLIDEINSDHSSDFIGGFPAHPHRGFQTLTYMIDGSFHHEDSMGNRGHVGAGGAQWMSAGSGVIHSEMPEPDGNKLHGFQLWINLPSTDKMSTPDYRDVQAEEISVYEVKPGVSLSAIAGEAEIDGQQYKAPLIIKNSNVSVLSLDMKGDTDLALNISQNIQVNIVVFEREIDGAQKGQMLNFTARKHAYDLKVAAQKAGAKILVLSGEPLREPIAQYGPFVMNTMEEVEQALQDYRDGTLVNTSESLGP